jgi:16S rRNA (adenine1518-N6/adenine1519-N6)-dimethyltransferase
VKRARRRFAQHFLEPSWIPKLVALVAPRPTDAILEIGAGRGALTLALAERCGRLVAVEIDRDLASRLRSAVPASVEVVEADILRVDLPALVRGLAAAPGVVGPVRIVGNLPYNISSPILFRLVALAHETGGAVGDATLMLQREVADRVTARPGGGDWGPLAIAIQRAADVRRLAALPPGAFRPAPRVHSAVVRLAFRPGAPPAPAEAPLDALVRALFTRRRKTLRNALEPFARTRGVDAAIALAEAGLDARRRPETLSLEELGRLAARFAGRGDPVL